MSKSEYIFSDKVETAFSCPRAGDPDHFTECCGPSWQRKCCAASKAEFGPIGGGGVISFFGIVTGIVIFICCLVLICCCCTPCCLLAKQRNRQGLVTTFAAILGVDAFSSLNRFCVHLLQHLRDWFPACLLPPNQRTTTRQPDLSHLATLVSLLLTLDHLRTIFLSFLSTKPNPQLTMNMPCDIRG